MKKLLLLISLLLSTSSCCIPQQEEQQCTICLEPLSIQQRITSQACCRGIFHTQCLQNWYKRSTICPLCITTHSILEAITSHKMALAASLIREQASREGETFGIEINRRYSNNWTLLHKASCSGYYDVTQLLLANGADVNASTDLGWTPLLIAAYKGHTDIVRLLLENGADQKATMKDDYHPIITWSAPTLAVTEGHVDTVHVLLENYNPSVLTRAFVKIRLLKLRLLSYRT